MLIDSLLPLAKNPCEFVGVPRLHESSQVRRLPTGEELEILKSGTEATGAGWDLDGIGSTNWIGSQMFTVTSPVTMNCGQDK